MVQQQMAKRNKSYILFSTYYIYPLTPVQPL